MSVVIGIDVGGSTTKIVGFRKEAGKMELIRPLFVSAADPITSIYGAFGKFTDENNLTLPDIERVMTTGVGASYLKKNIYGLTCEAVPEFDSIARGGLYLSGLSDCLVVSLGTGTALVHARRGRKSEYLGGTGVGGGTLVGLSRLLLKVDTVDHVLDMAEDGDLSNVDLRISDISAKNYMNGMPDDLTASNFGNVSDIASRADVARGILNLVYETVGVSAIFAAHACGAEHIVLTGNLTQFAFCKKKFEEFNRMYDRYRVHFVIPENAQFSTVIGTALADEGDTL